MDIQFISIEKENKNKVKFLGFKIKANKANIEPSKRMTKLLPSSVQISSLFWTSKYHHCYLFKL
jgi:hypothetical protein